MYEHEPELEGDFDWALFPARGTPIGGIEWIASKATMVLFVAVCWYASPVLGVVGTCLAFALPDVRNGRRMAKLIPDKAGARICSLFSYAWGAWKAGAASAGMFVLGVCLMELGGRLDRPNSPQEIAAVTALASMFIGFLASAGLTAAGIVIAVRSGMRVWIGNGMNQARTLLLAMLLVAFTGFVLIPWTVLLARLTSRTPVVSNPEISRPSFNLFFAVLFTGGSFMVLAFAAPILILIVLDRICRRVVAARPGKFGPKVPSVGKWNA